MGKSSKRPRFIFHKLPDGSISVLYEYVVHGAHVRTSTKKIVMHQMPGDMSANVKKMGRKENHKNLTAAIEELRVEARKGYKLAMARMGMINDEQPQQTGVN